MARHVIQAINQAGVDEISTPVVVPIGAGFTTQASKFDSENNGVGRTVNGADQLTCRISVLGTMPAGSKIVITPVIDGYGVLSVTEYEIATVTDDTIEVVIPKIEWLKGADHINLSYSFKQTGASYDVVAIHTQYGHSLEGAATFKLHAAVTNGTDGTYDYFVSMIESLRLGIAFVLSSGSGTVTIKIWGTLTNDGTPFASIADWVDITNDMYGVASFTASDLLNDDSDAYALFSAIKIEVVAATGGANDADWTLRTSMR